MIPNFPIFTNIHQVTAREYRPFVKHHEPYSDFNYISLFAWSGEEGCELSQLNGNLVVSFKDYQTDNQFMSFIGTNKPDETAVTLINFVRSQEGYDNSLYLVPEISAHALSDDFWISEDRDNHDYVLSARSYEKLEGKEFANKRKNLNKFVRLYGENTEIRQVDIKDNRIKNEVFQLVDKWFSYGSEGSLTARNEQAAITKLLERFALDGESSQLYITGLYIYGKLEGFCIFEIVDALHAITHFGKANPAYTKSYEYLMAETLKHIYQNFGIDFVNYEQDLGIMGLRQSKLDHHPIKFLKKYIVSAQ